MNEEQYICPVEDEKAGQRLDRFLAESILSLSRTRIQELLEKGHITCEGKTCAASRKVKAGEKYVVVVPPPVDLTLEAQSIPLDILYEDEFLLVLNKPAGLVVHPAPGHHDETLVNALLAHCGETLSGIGGIRRPGIVHRLDKDTSGLMVVAKTDQAHQALSRQFSDRTLSRRYDALVWGDVTPLKGEIEGNIGRSLKNRQKMAVLKSGGKEAKTLYQVKKKFRMGKNLPQTISWVSCKLTTGRTHQIRVHMSHRGHPLVGDTLYGQKRKGSWPEAVLNFPRQALHASELQLQHPLTQELMTFQTELPLDLKNLIDQLEQYCYEGEAG